MRKHLLALTAFALSISASSQVSRLGDDIEYKAELSGQFGDGDYTPFWQSANKYGLASTDNNSGYLRAGIQRQANADSLRKWRIGYGADLVLPFGYDSKFIVQQLFADFQYKAVRLTVGQKEHPLGMRNQELSSGGMMLGTNARPVPQVRIGVPEYWIIPKTKDLVAIKGHCAYGWFADNKWQRKFNNGNNSAVYTANSLYHSKAGYLRVGNKDKFPIVFTGGLEMFCQFGGTVWNRGIDPNQADGSYKFKEGIKEYLQAFIPSGSDITDEEHPNIMGNSSGSYQARIDYYGKGWGAAVYGEHYFEDHSQFTWQYGWKDFLWGVELNLPKNPIVSTIVAEHISTTDQSGPILVAYGDKVPYISGQDNYYNHNIYGAYQHAGFTMGNPLLLSPRYSSDGRIVCQDNRIKAIHLGIKGNPCDELSYRILYTHEKSLGNFNIPHENPKKGDFLLVEATYQPHQIKGLGITASYGMNHGDLLGKSNGGMLTISYSGWVK